MKKLTIISGTHGSGKTMYIDSLKRNLPKDVEFLDLEQKPHVRDNIIMGEVNPEKVKDFVLGVIDDIPMSVSEIIDLLFVGGYYRYEGKSYATHYIIATQIPKSDFPLSFKNHEEVEFIELPPLSDRKVVEQKIKDYLYSKLNKEQKEQLGVYVNNRPKSVDGENFTDIETQITIIHGMRGGGAIKNQTINS